jgi:phosphoenolpyruvate carboxykinase (ATP)
MSVTTGGVESPPANRTSGHGLEAEGIKPQQAVHWNLSPAELYERALARGEGRMTAMGGFAAVTSPHTGRSPNDKFTVMEPVTEKTVDWGKVNVAMSREHYDVLKADVLAYLGGQELFVRDCVAGADQQYALNVRVVTTAAWQNLFAYNMFLRPHGAHRHDQPDFTVLHAPEFKADPARHGTRSTTAIAVSFEDRKVVICGTRYAGEIKKSVFGALNFLLPEKDVFPMHCSANVGTNGGVALFFGLSGTGKTTLSADPERGLIGDDEHGWSNRGVYNFEGGCYAKAINLTREGEPEIYEATRMFGTILENVVLDKDTREIDFADSSIAENTRASYPIHFIPNAVLSGQGNHPDQVIFLTADAFGVLPPVAKLSAEQAMYHFLSGYTAKVAGTELGVKEPSATFSTCFGAPFLPRHPTVYAKMLGERLKAHGSSVWLINTGWTGGPFGKGTRMKLSYTRAMVRAVLSGALDNVETLEDRFFGLEVPVHVPHVPDSVLRPRDTWEDGEAYDAQARKLAAMFNEAFQRFIPTVSEAVRNAGPKQGV